jgi:glycosyltransferase involved in cell wall biosynthesis
MGSEAEERPAVSVVMPLHGDGEFLQLALDSVRSQSGASTEIICIDDGLTESAKAVIAGCSAGQRKIRLVRNEGRGIVAALNTGLCAARGEFIARMDADDVCLPDRFAVQLAYLRSHPDVVAVATQAILIDANGKQLRRLRTPVGCDRVYASLDVSCALIHPTVMMRKAAARRVGGYRIGFDGAEDHELWLRLRRISKLDNLPSPYYCTALTQLRCRFESSGVKRGWPHLPSWAIAS